jgi:hypothetical protein
MAQQSAQGPSNKWSSTMAFGLVWFPQISQEKKIEGKPMKHSIIFSCYQMDMVY